MLGLGQEVVVEGIGTSIFQNKVNFGGSLDGFDHFGDGGMVQFSEEIDFPL